MTSAYRYFTYHGTLSWAKRALIVQWQRTSGEESTAGKVEYVKAQLVLAQEAQAPRPPGAVTQTPDRLDGRNYYLLGEGVTCLANAPGHPRVKSWKNRLEFSRGNVLIWQSICNDNPITQTFDPEQFTVADDLSYVIYNDEKYTYYAEPPQLCADGQWCPAEGGQ
jgi:hypothetical protein